MRRAWTGFSAAAVACGMLSGGWAHAFGTLSSGEAAPLEQRVALAVGPDRTTLWTSVRVSSSGPGGALGIVAPAAPGAALDWSSSAWFEALEVATAPRVLAPPLECGGTAPATRLDIVGEMG
ncbi:MAG TPA: hypothetical protein VLS89_16100, partial [Candidatus Nanopelagicales bacterium]|nr:hypothetical protein [Candidatus Nanopelagicales bacterium]